MNSLSYLIYFAEVVGNARIFLKISTFAFLVVFVVYWVIASVHNHDNRELRYNKGEEKDPKKFLPLGICGAVFALLLVFVPTQKTVYLIAGSELGETVITSPEMKEIYTDLRAILKGYAKEAMQ